jgi:hypothetical protein
MDVTINGRQLEFLHIKNFLSPQNNYEIEEQLGCDTT